jgi:hypothetical protein
VLRSLLGELFMRFISGLVRQKLQVIYNSPYLVRVVRLSTFEAAQLILGSLATPYLC